MTDTTIVPQVAVLCLALVIVGGSAALALVLRLRAARLELRGSGCWPRS